MVDAKVLLSYIEQATIHRDQDDQNTAAEIEFWDGKVCIKMVPNGDRFEAHIQFTSQELRDMADIIDALG
jgi:hypothetical protein